MRSLSWRNRRASLPRPAHGVGVFTDRPDMEARRTDAVPERHFVPKTGAELATPAVVHVQLEGAQGEASGAREVLDPLQTIAK